MSNWVNYLGWRLQRESQQFFKNFVFWVNVHRAQGTGCSKDELFFGMVLRSLELPLNQFDFWKAS